MKKRKVSILIVDDTPTNLQLVERILRPEGYELTLATDGIEALREVNRKHFDLILLDVMMPRMDGFEVCRKLKINSITKDIPVIFLTAVSDISGITEGFQVGGVDYIVKPFKPVELKARIKTHLELKFLREKDVEQTQRDIVMTLGFVGELRSKDTGKHVERVAEYSGLMADLCGMDEDEVEIVKLAAAMHDIGKVAVPDAILNKPGRLNDEERLIMNKHTQWGHYIFNRSQKPILQAAATIAYEHHEKWDGSGYPRGLKGESIHIYGRIAALVDVFDALGTVRSYKEAWDLNDIFATIRTESGKHFDPKLVDLFIDNYGDFLAIRERLSE